MRVLEGVEPREVFYFFEEICGIPHGSGNMDEISDYCVAFAKQRGLFCHQDAMKNIIIKKQATKGYENEETIILQGHLDMVCEKKIDSEFDFETQKLELEYDGKYLSAKDTTLGGDDGVAVAMALAILDSDTIAHPDLEVILTVDEEIGLLGAADIDLSLLKGKKMINIDSDEEGFVLTSCAGGTFIKATIPLVTEEKKGVFYEIILTGMQGGHSGTEIHKGRGNSNVIMGRVLLEALLPNKGEVISVNGGNKDNAIPRHTVARILVSKENTKAFEEKINQLDCCLKKEFSSSDDGIKIELKKEEEKVAPVLSKESKCVVINALNNFPNGIQSMSMEIEGLVQTSLNLGILESDQEKIELHYCIRSSVESEKKYLSQRLIYMVESLGGSCEENGDYPGWQYKKDSVLRDTIVKVYTRQYGEEPGVGAIHAGLECGLLSAKIEGLDCVSLGPNLYNIHSYEEKLDVESTQRTWKLLLGVLGEKIAP